MSTPLRVLALVSLCVLLTLLAGCAVEKQSPAAAAFSSNSASGGVTFNPDCPLVYLTPEEQTVVQHYRDNPNLTVSEEDQDVILHAWSQQDHRAEHWPESN